MKKLVLGSIFLGLASLSYSQSSECGSDVIKLSNVEISPVDQAYLDNVGGGAVSSTVYVLETKASRYNVKEHPYFTSNPDKIYNVSFVQSNGKINASYDQNGKIQYAYEKYQNLALPSVVRNSAYKENPDWTLNGSAYTVYYNGKDAKKMYKVELAKDKQKKILKFDIDGNRID